jgi:hypothetical protein
MKDIELHLWWSDGLDSDGYESPYSISNKDYARIASIVKRYAKGISEGGNTYVDPEELNECFKQKAPQLYDKINKKVKADLTATTKQTADEWFNVKEEGCTIEEYIDNVYTCGFYISEKFISQILSQPEH